MSYAHQPDWDAREARLGSLAYRAEGRVLDAAAARQAGVQISSARMLQLFNRSRLLKRALKKFRVARYNYEFVWWTYADWNSNPLDLLRAALRQGLQVIAVDTEFSRVLRGDVYVSQVHELGWSRLDQNGMQVTRNLLYTAGGRRRKVDFKHGFVQAPPIAEARGQFAQAVGEADVVLFYDMSGDIPAIAEAMGLVLPPGSALDMKSAVTYVNNEGSENYYNLADFCSMHGVRLKHPHNAGNDAHALLQASLQAARKQEEPKP